MASSYKENSNVILEVRNISKHFGKVQALDDMSLSFYQGEIHTLLGENGAGKSTLMNIIYGLYYSDYGEILLNGQKQEIKSPKNSLSLSIGMVPQSFKLVSDMSIIENAFLFMPKKNFLINKNQLREKVKGFSKLFNFGIEEKLDVEICDLSEGEKQKVEILKLLIAEVKIMLFDEATNVLAPNEVNAFLKVIKDMNKRGYTILYITHRLQEALKISDRISVLRKGKLVGTVLGEEATYNKLTKMMIGEEFSRELNISREKRGKVNLSTSNINVFDNRGIHVVRDASFEFYEGEILGLAGIEGNGSDQLVEAIMGLQDVQSGNIQFYGEDITELSTFERMRKGISFLSGSNSLVPLFSIRENSILDYPGREPFSKKGILNWCEINKHAKKIIENYQVKTPSIFLQAAKLSGGNKQRLSVGKKIESNPKLMIAYHPTKGLDFNSKKYIQEKFLEMKRNKSTIFFISPDLSELFQICDRLMVIYRGEIVGTFNDISKISELEIGVLMTGGFSYTKKEVIQK